MTSTKSRSKAWSYFRFRTGQNRVMWILLTVLNLMGFPLLFTTANILYRASDDRFDDLMGAIAIISILSLVIAVIISLFVVYSAFDYLTKKVLSDMTYSTPITNNQRFLSDWFSGLFTAVSPFVVGIVIGYIPALFMRGRVLATGDFNTMLSVYSQVALAIIIALTMAYAIGAFVTMCCGAKLEAIGYSILVHGIIPISIFVTVYSAFRYFSYNSLMPVDDICLKWIATTSPIGILINLIASRAANYYYDGILQPNPQVGYVKIFSFGFLFTSILIIALLFALTMFLNTKRKAEKCGNPFVFKGLYYTCMSLFVYCAVMICVANKNTTTTVVLIAMTIIVYMLLEVLKNRGFKRIWVGAVRLAVTLAVSCALAFGIVGIGTAINNKVPSENDVKSVSISYINPNYSYGGISVEISDKETISKLLAIHKNKVDELNKTDDENWYLGNNYYSYHGMSDKVVYKLNNGLTITRCFSLTTQEIIELKDILATEQYKQAYINKVKSKSIPKDSQIILEDLDGAGTGTNIDASVFMEAYIKDLENMNTKEFQMPSVQPICLFSYSAYENGYGQDYPIYADFTNTIELIKTLGYDGLMESVSGLKISEYSKYTEIYVMSPEIKDYKKLDEYDEEKDEWIVKEELSDSSVISRMANLTFNSDEYGPQRKDVAAISGVDYIVSDADTELTDEEIKNNAKINELLKVAIPYGISDKPLYSISIAQRTYLIPEEYSSLAREVMQNGVNVIEYEKKHSEYVYDYENDELQEVLEGMTEEEREEFLKGN